MGRGSERMDAVIDFLETIRDKKLAQGHFHGLLHCLIGRRITAPGGQLISAGMTFRDVAVVLKRVRWEPEDVRELGLDPQKLPPRDRERYWFLAICQAQVDGQRGKAAGDRFGETLRAEGYDVALPPASPAR